MPCRLEGEARGATGQPIVSYACTNVDAVYRMDLPARRDADRDGFPDRLDACPKQTGFADGCKDIPAWNGP